MCEYLNESINEWMIDEMNEQMDKWIERRWIHEWTINGIACMDGLMHRWWVEGWMDDGWKDEWMNDGMNDWWIKWMGWREMNAQMDEWIDW
jgi:hypothetical protein